MTAATTYATAMPIDDESNNDQFGGSDTEEDQEQEESPPPATPDDTVYCNKQLTAHLIKQLCSRTNRRSTNNHFNGSARSSSSSNNSSYRSSGIGNNNNILVGNSSNGPVGYDRSNSDSTRSYSPVETQSAEQSLIRPPQLQQPHYQAQAPVVQRDSIDSSQVSSGYLSASSASGISGLYGASPAYVSPFALSPLNENAPRSSAWSRPAISLDVIKSARTAELETVLFKLCDEFEDRLHGRFDSFSSRLDTEPATIRESVTRELETLFYDDNIHWGRIIAVFVLTKEICDKCLSEGRPELSEAVQQWVAEFIDQHLWQWVRKNQGWYGLIRFYQETGGDQAGSGGSGLFSSSGVWQSMALLLTVSAVSIAIALTSSYFRR
ncbi:hypothetical protein BOX15_Mlig024444g2 [Macrostomum lignano]|uniref:Bcl-2 Bcl-2 homology region 1-3 domain-containing protein n=1 Tax=Macrostomum lignano TaxID=282301 RepID=A0A267E6V8_9PLAT|nr:hypothetical protein BOX15_Mlig024444g3 [Macrostomum lignano]PAA58199.1 hypothetical protein BOX15_Mlig024444g2 [Macrostomum lignano]